MVHTIAVPRNALKARDIGPGTTPIVVPEYRLEQARKHGCGNFLELVRQIAENSWLDVERPDTFPHVDSRSFRLVENWRWGGYSIAYDVCSGRNTEVSGSAVEPTAQPGVWRLL